MTYQLGIKQYDFPYHYYRLIWNRNLDYNISINDLKFRYPKLTIEIDSNKFNFVIDKLSNYNSYLRNDSNDLAILGYGGTLEFEN